MKRRLYLPPHLRDVYCPQRRSTAGRVLEWFATQPPDAFVAEEALAERPEFYRFKRSVPPFSIPLRLRGALAAGYLKRGEGREYSRGPAWPVYAALRVAVANARREDGFPAYPIYSPPHHSWARVVCEYFRENPDEELTLHDIETKLSNPQLRAPMSAGRADWFLGRVCREGYLQLKNGIYSAGPNINKLPKLFEDRKGKA